MNINNLFEVWHAVTPRFIDNPDATLAAFPEGFVHVADVEADNVLGIFELTNSIDRGWWENPEVTMVAEGCARSTSVGDVIVKAIAVGINEDGSPVWARWSVDNVGYRKF